MRLLTQLIAALVLLAPSAANAAEIVYSQTLSVQDPLQFQIDGDSILFRLDGQNREDVTVNPGDTVYGTIDFGGDRIQVSDTGSAVVLFMPFVTYTGSVWAEGSFSFTGLQGDYIGPDIITASSSCCVILGGSFVGDLTKSSFSFTGLTYSAKYLSGAVTSFEPYVPLHLARIDSFSVIESAVPEPATWVMMLLGFGSIGTAMRRRKSSLALV